MEKRKKERVCGCCGKKANEGGEVSTTPTYTQHPQHQPLRKCSRCKAVYYCNQACQRKHWPIHKPHCHTKQTASKPTSPSPSTPSAHKEKLKAKPHQPTLRKRMPSTSALQWVPCFSSTSSSSQAQDLAPNCLVILHPEDGDVSTSVGLAKQMQLSYFECICPSLSSCYGGTHSASDDGASDASCVVWRIISQLVTQCGYAYDQVFVLGLLEGGSLAISTALSLSLSLLPSSMSSNVRLGGVINLNGDANQLTQQISKLSHKQQQQQQQQHGAFETPVLSIHSLKVETRSAIESLSSMLSSVFADATVETHQQPSIINSTSMPLIYTFLSSHMVTPLKDMARRGDIQEIQTTLPSQPP